MVVRSFSVPFRPPTGLPIRSARFAAAIGVTWWLLGGDLGVSRRIGVGELFAGKPFDFAA